LFLKQKTAYEMDLKSVAERLNREWATTPVRVHAVMEYYRATQTDYIRALEKQGYSDVEIGTHAGLADTSLMLAVDPRLVRTARLQPGVKPDNGDGVTGDPRPSSAELGQLGAARVVTGPVRAINRATSQRCGIRSRWSSQ